MARQKEKLGEDASIPFISRDISWLHFNHRVLQEAGDLRVPLYERIKFLAIYSSNLDEFFRVRVASLRSFRKLEKSMRRKMNLKKPKRTLRRIRKMVGEQQSEFGKIFKEEILPALAERGIHLIGSDEFSREQAAFAEALFDEKLRELLSRQELQEGKEEIFLENKALYFAIQWEKEEHRITLIRIPTHLHPRFIVFPQEKGEGHAVTFLDDIVRHNIPRIFPGKTLRGAYAVKLSRDAELYIEDEYSGDLVQKLKAALEERDSGLPTRFLFDSAMPDSMLARLRDILGISKYELIPGARYHNFNDFFSFPDPLNDPELHNPPRPPLEHPELRKVDNIMQAIAEKDYILHFPYQSFDYVLKFLEEAVYDPAVQSIRITLYRVASDSKVAALLLEAIRQGKQVTAFIEAKARFDEASNLYWGERLKEAGGNVLFSLPGIKVHTKLFMVERLENDQLLRYAYVGTGNFNEKTARIYADHALLTSDRRITDDVAGVFRMLETEERPNFSHLFVSPHHLRRQFTALIDAEIARAREGKPAYMILKMNSLEDEGMIAKLYEASQAGVDVKMIVRGICCIRAAVEGLSEGIQCRSIVDRYLEHARVYIFGNGGEERMYIASADWMNRNLDHRVEVAAPILDRHIQAEIRQIIELQLKDNTKARSLEEDSLNEYVANKEQAGFRAQPDTYVFLQSKLNGG